MAIKGSLEEASLPDVLQLLSMGRKTGRLSVTDWTNLGYIFVDSGRITFATLVNRRDRLGDILLKSGKITQEQLTAALQVQQREPNKKLGQALLETGAIDRADLESHVRVQIEEAAYFLFTWRRGNFTFESDLKPEDEEFLVSIEPESLLLEGARRTDEWTLVEKKIPSFDLVFKVDEERLASAETNLSEHQKQLIPLVDGTRNVAALVDESGLVEFDVGKAIYELVNAGLAHAIGRRKTESDADALAAPPVDGARKEGDAEHFDYVQLATYLARDGDFADPDRRKEAALHITDCAVCSKRLREIHRRRSGTIKTLPDPDEPPNGDPGAGHLSDVDLFTYVAREGEYESAERRKQAAQHIADCTACTKRLKRIHRRRTGSVSGASRALSAHFDDLQLITYAAREGEFVDPQRRREVAFHVADCSSCSKRLKEIHRRRKQQPPASPTVSESATAEEQQKTEPVPERRSGLDRRVSDGSRRQVGADRRVTERRSGRDRRVSERRRSVEKRGRRAVERRTGVERRRADRRVSDRRIAERRSSGGVWPVLGGGGAAVIAPMTASGAATAAAIRTSGGATAPVLRRREAPQAQRTAARETRSRIPLEGAVPADVERQSVEPAEKPAASAGRSTGAGAPTRSDRASAPAGIPGVMKEQSESLIPPKTEFRLLENERKSLAGLPLLDVDSPKREAAEAHAMEIGAAEDGPVARGSEVAAEPVARESTKPTGRAAEDADTLTASDVDSGGDRREATPAIRAKSPKVETRVEPTPPPAAEPPPRVRGTPVSLRGPDDDWDSSLGTATRGTPRSLRELDPDPAGAVGAATRASSDWRRTVRWQSVGRWAAVVAVALGAWFGRPIVQSVFGGGDSTGGTPELASTGVTPGGVSQPPAEPEVSRIGSTETASVRDSVGPPVEAGASEARQPPTAREVTREVAGAREARPAGEVTPVRQREAAAEETPPQPEVPAPAEPALPRLSGTVRAGGSGAPLAGVRVAIPGAGFTTTSDAAGTFSFDALPAGSLSVVAELEGYVPASEGLVSVPGNDLVLSLVLRPPPAALERDEELAGDQWQTIGPDEAESILARPAPVIGGLWLESLAKPTAGTRPRVRVAQLTGAGERVTLIVTRAGPPVRNPEARVTAMRVIPPTEAYPVTTGTASFGNLLVTAKATVSADSLRAMLSRLADSGGPTTR